MATSFSRVSVLLCAAALVFVSAACGDDAAPPRLEPEADAAYSCIDNDGDSYGDGCLAGDDCDDTNPDVARDCMDCERDPIEEGCPCDLEDGMLCEPEPIPTADGMLVCRDGARFCRDSAWTACIAQGDYVLIPN
jgi:hypothetical protein